MRYFNTLGPVNETEHYIVPRRELIADLVAQIERGTYFTLYAPRQMGKTTLLRQLAEVLQDKADYLPVTLSFEDFENLPVTEFINAFWSELVPRILDALKTRSLLNTAVQKLLTNHSPTHFVALRKWLEDLHQDIEKIKIILIIDEFDAIPQSAISPLLQTWRKIYLASEPPRPLHSVILVGLQNIATLNLGRSSPFNIARQIQLPAFTLAQVRELFNQYTRETAQAFAKGVIEEIHALTGGQPFLVNRLAAILTEEIATERTRPISHANLLAALSKLVRERNYNYETLVRHAKSYQEPVLRINAISCRANTPVRPYTHLGIS